MTSFRIHAPSDGQPYDWTWRDAHVKQTLADALCAAGAKPAYVEPDLEVYLWAWITSSIAAEANNVIWVIGHPDLLLKQDLKAMKPVFKRWFCASKPFAHRLRRDFGIDAHWLPCPAPPREPAPPLLEHRYDACFVGNADPNKDRGMINGFLRAHDSLVYGGGWKERLGAADGWAGPYIPWKDLHRAWSSARLVPYTEHSDMAREGFVADSALDTMVNSTALVLPRKNRGYEDLGLSVEQWDNPEQLRTLAEGFLLDECKRVDVAAKLKKQAAQYNYESVAETILNG